MTLLDLESGVKGQIRFLQKNLQAMISYKWFYIPNP